MTKVLLLYDEITPALAKDFVGQMSKLAPMEPVAIAINSPGGSVPAGDAIALAIDRHAGPTTAQTVGIAASAASFLAMFCDRLVMAPESFLMLHNPYVEMLAGDAKKVSNVAKELAEMESRYARTYALRSAQPEADVRRMMDNETWLSATHAVELGFADAIDSALETAKTVAKAVLKFKRTPIEVRAMAGDRVNFERSAERRARLRKRALILAQHGTSSRDPVRERQDREAAERQRRRFELHAQLQRLAEDNARRDEEEREAARKRLRADYFYDHARTPREQRRY